MYYSSYMSSVELNYTNINNVLLDIQKALLKNTGNTSYQYRLPEDDQQWTTFTDVKLTDASNSNPACKQMKFTLEHGNYGTITLYKDSDSKKFEWRTTTLSPKINEILQQVNKTELDQKQVQDNFAGLGDYYERADGLDTIDRIKAVYGNIGLYYFICGNIMKYRDRIGNKGDEKDAVADLRKIKHYESLLEDLVRTEPTLRTGSHSPLWRRRG